MLLLQDLLKNVTLLYNEYLVIANDTSIDEDCEHYVFFCEDFNTEQELLEEIGLTCPHFLTREIISMSATRTYKHEYDSYFSCLEIAVSL